MPSSWNVYYVIFLSAALALGIPVFLGFISYLVSPSGSRKRHGSLGSKEAEERSKTEDRTALGRRINARFFLGINAALILMTLMLAVIPCAGSLRSASNPVLILKNLVAIITLAGFAALGLFYATKKGDLSWLKSFQKTEGDDSK